MKRKSRRRSILRTSAQVAIFLVAVVYCGVTLGAPPASSSASSETATRVADQTCPSGQVASRGTEGAAGFETWDVQMWQLINRDRLAKEATEETKGHAKPLEWDARLAAVARAHSEEMANRGVFGHKSADGSTPDVRISRMGIQWRASGENIAKYPDVAQAEAAFMNEPKFQSNHRGNILNADYTHVGVGVVKGPDGMFYITQEFAQLR